MILLGDRYNYLVCIKEPYSIRIPGKHTKRVALFRCDCGNEKEISIYSVKSNQIKSCGCYHKIAVGKRTTSRNKKYKCDTKHPLYNTFNSIKNRCYSKGYGWYLGGNIQMYSEWKNNYDKFYEWGIDKWFKNSKLVRLDDTKDFTPDNCIFISASEHGKKNSDKGAERREQKFIDKYGCSNPFSSDVIKEKIRNTNIQKYGDEFYRGKKNKEENELREFIESITGKKFGNNSAILNGKEIDIYNDEYKIGIEYCGLLWHSEHFNKDSKYHINKMKKCTDNNVRLITIFADEWCYRKEQVKSRLMSIFSTNCNNIYARKCLVKEIDKSIGCKFIDLYHIQGSSNRGLIYFGIFHNQELLGVMSFSKHHRGYDGLVLDRLVFKTGYNIVGGTSKLLKYGIKYAKDNGYHQIISWSDNRWSIGTVYSAIGFTLDLELPPDYSYVKLSNSKKRKSKHSCTKSAIKCPSDKTESEYMIELGYTRIWDCGKKKWILNV